MKQKKMLIEINLFYIFLFALTSCTFRYKVVSCEGSIERFVPAFLNNIQHGASLIEINIPKTKMGKKTNIDYFNLDIGNFDNNSSSHLVDGTKITLYNNTKSNIYSIFLKTESRDSAFLLEFNSLKIKNIDFIGKGIDGNYYFTIEQENSCNKMYVREDYTMFFSEY